MALTLTEGLIRNRVNLTHENLEDIKSLSLPGTFHEKIITIGTSLNKFTRLKSLDFSRNALESLKGLEHLELLERLNLYYNNVSTLEELSRLRHNQNLRDLDLRLNPVTRNEPDYRLYLIHMLPNLQKLDDRGVRDRERQAALTHFSSSQASEMTPPTLKTQKQTAKSPLPRTEMMAKLMKVPSVLVDDDEAVIDMMNRQNGDLGKPRPLTGSANKENRAEDYSMEGLKKLDEPRLPRHQSEAPDKKPFNSYNRDSDDASDPPLDPQLALYRERYPNIMANPSDCLKKIGTEPIPDPNLRYADEQDANSKYKGQGYFTPHPDGPQDLQDGMSGQRSRLSRDDLVLAAQSGHKRTNSVPNTMSSSLPIPAPPKDRDRDNSNDQEKVLLNSLLNLVDRYWNGSKSLHKHQKFIEQALRCLSDYNAAAVGVDVESLKIKLYRLEEDNEALRREKRAVENDHRGGGHHTTVVASANEAELKHALKRAREDVERLHQELKQYVSENVALRKRLEDQGSSSVGAVRNNNAGAAAESPGYSQGIMDDLQRQNNSLTHEIEVMRSKVKQYSQLQEVTLMLQESHKSLVETNEHLLSEMREMKHKHQDEIRHMQWSYQQLKSSMLYGNSNNNTATTTSHNNHHHNNHHHHHHDDNNISNNNNNDSFGKGASSSSRYHHDDDDQTDEYGMNERPSVSMY